jgi:hypothetical protein
MKTAGLVLTFALLGMGQVCAQTQTSAPAGAQESGAQGSAMADGTAFNATLDKSVDSKKCKPGDPVTAHTTEAVKSGGKTILPKGTRIEGHVTQASARNNGEATSSLGIVFDKAVIKKGEEMPMNMAIQALGAPSDASAAANNMEPMGSSGGYSGGTTNAAGGRPGMSGATQGGAVNGMPNGGAPVASTGDESSGTPNAGQFTPNSRGVFGLKGLNLGPAPAAGGQGSLITSTGKDVHLDSGTRMLLVSQTTAAATR